MPETKQYGIIYADPPWHYDRKHGSGVAENHYPTMSIEEICALPVSELAAKDSALFLWATFPQLNEAFRVIDAWGFKYKTLAYTDCIRTADFYTVFLTGLMRTSDSEKTEET